VGILDWFRNPRTSPLQLPPPQPQGLKGVLSVSIYDMKRRLLLHTAHQRDLDELVKALDAEPVSSGICMCAGTLHLHFLGVSGRVITLHHGTSIRWREAAGNHVLTNPDAIMDWLSGKGITFVREEHEASRRRDEEYERQAARWLEALPRSLREFFPAMRGSRTSDPAWTAAIEREFPDPVERTKVLLELFGSGVGLWSGYPNWESVPEEMLLNYPLEVLFSAIRASQTPALYVGAVRLFCSWDFRKRRRKLRKRIPPELRQALLAYAVNHRDACAAGQLTKALTQRATKRQEMGEAGSAEDGDSAERDDARS
jgi:hypothetical protein